MAAKRRLEEFQILSGSARVDENTWELRAKQGHELNQFEFSKGALTWGFCCVQGPVVQKQVNANLGLKVNQGFCFSC